MSYLCPQHGSYQNLLRKQRKQCNGAGVGQMQNNRSWDLKVVDSWPLRKMAKRDLEKLLGFDGTAAAIIDGVGTLKLGSCISHAN